MVHQAFASQSIAFVNSLVQHIFVQACSAANGHMVMFHTVMQETALMASLMKWSH